MTDNWQANDGVSPISVGVSLPRPYHQLFDDNMCELNVKPLTFSTLPKLDVLGDLPAAANVSAMDASE